MTLLLTVLAFGMLGVPGLQEDKPDESAARSRPRLRYEAKALYWRVLPRGRLSADDALGADFSDPQTAPRISLDRDAELDSAGGIWEGEFELSGFRGPEHWDFGFRAHYSLGRWSGSGALSEPEDLGASVLPAGTPVESELEMHYGGIDFLISPHFISPESPWSLEIGLGLRVGRLILEIDTPSGSIDDISGIVGPVLSVEGEWRPTPLLSIRSRLEGAGSVGYPVVRTSVGAALVWNSLSLELGYRWQWSDLDLRSEVTRISLQGYVVGISFSF